jgi:hypothetical protein
VILNSGVQGIVIDTKRKSINDPSIRLALTVVEFFYESCLDLGTRGGGMLSGRPPIPDLSHTALIYLEGFRDCAAINYVEAQN